MERREYRGCGWSWAILLEEERGLDEIAPFKIVTMTFLASTYHTILGASETFIILLDASSRPGGISSDSNHSHVEPKGF